MSIFLQHTVNGLSLGAIYALVALGYTMVYGVLKLINFAHAEVFMLGAFVGYFADRVVPPWPPVLRLMVILLLAMMACAMIGLAIERIAYRPLRTAPRLNSLITAIGVSLFIQAVCQLPWLIGPSPRFFPTLLANRPLIEVVGVQVWLLQTLTFISTLGLMAALHHLVFHTHVGTEMRAVSFDVQTAALMGIHPDLVIARTFMIGSALAAAAGIFVGLNYPRIEPTMGVMLGLKAFVAAVLGGIGNVRGAMLGGLLIGLLEAWVAGYGLSSLRDAVSFAVLILVLVARPAGLLGRAGVEKV